MFLTVSDISKSYGIEQVLKNISFVLNANRHVGLVGANGVGKSTLLKIIVGEVEADSGRATIAKGVEVGYLPQTIPDFLGKTVDDLINEAVGNLRQIETHLRRLSEEISRADGERLSELLAEYGDATETFERRGGYEIDYRVDSVLDGLQLGHISRDREVVTLSGGEKARMGLASLLIRSPDLMLLDEPTNHLDFVALEWLEPYLQSHRGALLVVSHDRQFLNRTVNAIVEIDEHSKEGKVYPGSYEAYLSSKALERVKMAEAYERQQEEIKELRQALRGRARSVGHKRPARDGDKMLHKFFGERVQQTESRNIRAVEEKLRRIEANPIPRPPEEMRISPDFDPYALRGRTPLVVSGIGKSFGGRHVLRDVSFALGVDSRVVLVGPNGAGKSTLLRVIAGIETPDSGEVIFAPSVKVGYLDQELETLDLTQTVLEAYGADLPLSEEKLISDLIRYGLFLYEDVRKPIGALSIGQRRKLQVAKLIAERANLLLLDEPTNYVSFDVLEELEKALSNFPGPILAVSHDRRFIQQFAREVWELRDGDLIQHTGGFEGYLAVARCSSLPIK